MIKIRTCIVLCKFLFLLSVKEGVNRLDEQIIIALISFVGTLTGSVGGIFAASKLSNYRIEQLEKKVDKHNNLIERVYMLEQREAVLDNKLKSAEHRIHDLEQ